MQHTEDINVPSTDDVQDSVGPFDQHSYPQYLRFGDDASRSRELGQLLRTVGDSVDQSVGVPPRDARVESVDGGKVRLRWLSPEDFHGSGG